MGFICAVQAQSQLTFSTKYISFAEMIDKEDDPYGKGLDNPKLPLSISYDKLISYFNNHGITKEQRIILKINELKHPLLRNQPNSDIVHAKTIYQSERGRVEVLYTKKNVSEYSDYYKRTTKQTVVYEYMVSYDSWGNYVNSILSGQFRFSYCFYSKEMIQDSGGLFMRLTTLIRDYKNILQEEGWEEEIGYERYMLTPSLHFQKKPYKENEFRSF